MSVKINGFIMINCMIRHIWVAVGLLCCIFGARSYAADWKEDIQVSGHVKSYVMAVEQADIDGDPSENDDTEGISNNKIRLKVFWNPSDKLSFELAYALMPNVQGTSYDSAISFLDIEKEPYRIDDFDPVLYPDQGDEEGSFILAQNLDRLVFTISPRFGDIRIGRQAISFGKARVINPTDIILPYNFNELDVEYRIGVDAIRLTLPTGDLGEMEFGMIFGRNAYTDLSADYICSKFYIVQTDVELMVMNFRENLMGGMSFSRSVKGAGIWLEIAYTWVDFFSDYDEDQDYFKATTGIDYNINVKNGIVVFLEYHYNGASSGDPETYAWQVLQDFPTAYDDGSTFLLGEHYIIPGFTTQITPLISCNGVLLWNLTDKSFFVMPRMEYNVAENVYISIGAGIAHGKKSAYDSDNLFDLPVPLITSEFGLYPEFFFASLKYYF